MRAVAEEIAYCDPVDLLNRLGVGNYTVFLDSARVDHTLGRYSFIATDPVSVINYHQSNSNYDPFVVLTEILNHFEQEHDPTLPPFQGGMAGIFSYDLVRSIEKLPSFAIDDLNCPEIMLGIYDCVIAFDHCQRRCWIISNGYPESDLNKRRQRAHRRIEALLTAIADGTPQQSVPPIFIADDQIYSHFDSSSYQKNVQQFIEYILAGDIFEANLSQRFSTAMPNHLDPWELYNRLRINNAAPFSAFLKMDDITIASASPERFLQCHSGFVETRPIKGTRPRSNSCKEDEKLQRDLLQSVKDQAENTMIVDLMRNDLSKVCKDHSVKVPQLCGLESFATVHHLVSVVNAQLSDDKTILDLLKACFPGGSITGAPKIRAMEIIEQHEPTRRGPYCGSIGYLGFDATMDLSIVIRTIVINKTLLTYQVGGAIVMDSDPKIEYQETLAKAEAIKQTLCG